MRVYDFVISYDISDPKRLRKIAKKLERKAMRIQYSVYLLFDATQEEVTLLLEELTGIFNEERDDIRVYRIKDYGIHMGSATDLSKPYDFF
jgi:CRISPR-associated protein Cas2